MNFYLETDHPIAIDSPDHIEPRSTAKDNSTSARFNKRLLELYENKKPSVLDLGCSGGGLVKSLIDDGCVSVGLEGSDYSLNNQRAEWAIIPESLFTCDLGFPFTLHTGDYKPYKFDVITAWEFLEHLPEDRLETLLENIKRHIKPGGLVIGSISDFPSVWKVIDHHQTKKPLWWWSSLFGRYDFKRRTDLESHFEVSNSWVRKVKYNFVFQEDEY